MYEWAGTAADVKLHVPPGAACATATNLMETPEAPRPHSLTPLAPMLLPIGLVPARDQQSARGTPTPSPSPSTLMKFPQYESSTNLAPRSQMRNLPTFNSLDRRTGIFSPDRPSSRVPSVTCKRSRFSRFRHTSADMEFTGHFRGAVSCYLPIAFSYSRLWAPLRCSSPHNTPLPRNSQQSSLRQTLSLCQLQPPKQRPQ